MNLSPGTYNVVGGLDVHAGTTISGTGITLYVKGGGTVNGGSTMAISAPTPTLPRPASGGRESGGASQPKPSPASGGGWGRASPCRRKDG